MRQSFLIKYAEIGIKGKNRYIFEKALVANIQDMLSGVQGDFSVTKEYGRVYVDADGCYDYDEVVGALKHVFGIHSICPMSHVIGESIEEITKQVLSYIDNEYPQKNFTFKVACRRVRKSYPLGSMEINALLGEKILEAYPGLKVDVHNPDVVINIEIRDHINIYSKELPGPSGMPVGTSGKAMLLLSGGIDSPVAGWMTAKRGVKLSAVYFHAPPYTSERAKQKVIDLAKIVAGYAGNIRLYVVDFATIQMYIYDKCPHEELTIIMRRYMMRIAEILAQKENCQGLVTGEAIGQVASQTMQSLEVTNEVCSLPVLRPLIAFDKQEIVDVSLKIGTYETSILPYEDCCTTFVAKHPVTKPSLNIIKRSESRLGCEIKDMVNEAVENAEILEIGR